MSAKEKLSAFLKQKNEKSVTSSLGDLGTFIRREYSEKLNVIKSLKKIASAASKTDDKFSEDLVNVAIKKILES